MERSSKKVNLMESIEVEKIPIRRDSFSRNAYVIEFPLDSQPDYVWQVIFEREWKSSLDLWERKVVIVGGNLLLMHACCCLQAAQSSLQALSIPQGL